MFLDLPDGAIEKAQTVLKSMGYPLQQGDILPEILAVILHHEGGAADHPADKGGPTKYGISLKTADKLYRAGGGDYLSLDIDHDGKITADDIRQLPLSEALHIFHKEYVVPVLDRIGPYTGPLTKIKIIDLAVNVGQRAAFKILQRAVRACGGGDLDDDGIIGKKTIAGLRWGDDDSMVAAIRSEAAGYYRLIATRAPSQLVFLEGWLNRAYF